jgi:hypothetical protein
MNRVSVLAEHRLKWPLKRVRGKGRLIPVLSLLLTALVMESVCLVLRMFLPVDLIRERLHRNLSFRANHDSRRKPYRFQRKNSRRNTKTRPTPIPEPSLGEALNR